MSVKPRSVTPVIEWWRNFLRGVIFFVYNVVTYIKSAVVSVFCNCRLMSLTGMQ